MNINPQVVRQAIANLLLQHPELFDDEESRALSIESETPAIDYLRTLEHTRREAECMAGAIASQIAQLELRQARFVQQEKACRKLAHQIMDAAALSKIVMPEATYSIGKPRDRVQINDEQSVPSVYRHPPAMPKPDMKRIKDALDGGEKFNWAAIIQGEPSLTVRTK
jgi:hypothetical protein